MTPDAGSAFRLLGHEDVKRGLWAPVRHARLAVLPLAILRTLWLNHPQWPLDEVWYHGYHIS
jgi:hypothetical protein